MKIYWKIRRVSGQWARMVRRSVVAFFGLVTGRTVKGLRVEVRAISETNRRLHDLVAEKDREIAHLNGRINNLKFDLHLTQIKRPFPSELETEAITRRQAEQAAARNVDARFANPVLGALHRIVTRAHVEAQEEDAILEISQSGVEKFLEQTRQIEAIRRLKTKDPIVEEGATQDAPR